MRRKRRGTTILRRRVGREGLTRQGYKFPLPIICVIHFYLLNSLSIHVKIVFLIDYIIEMKSFLTFLVTIGTVIGSGFLSGKEIVVFFSRFGLMSFPCIAFAFFLFWGLFYFFLLYGKEAVNELKKPSTAILNIAICVIISSAMIAGSIDLISFAGDFISFLFLMALLVAMFFIIKNGIGSVEKFNLVLVPVMLVVLLFNIIFKFGGSIQSSHFSFAGFYYAFMYVVLNCSNSGIIIAQMGKDLSKKQKARVSFFSALALCVVLCLTNIALLQNQSVFSADMPLLALFDGWQRLIMQAVVMLGCVTTLFSLIYSLSSCLRGLFQSKVLVYIFCMAPLVISFLGFGKIVSYLYPLTSILGGLLIVDLFFLPLYRSFRKKFVPHDK